MTLKDKSQKMLGGLHKLGKKYGFKPSPEKPPEYIIKTDPPDEHTRDYHHYLSCRTGEESSAVITVIVCDNWIDVFSGHDVPNRINVGNQVDNALQEVERLLTGN